MKPPKPEEWSMVVDVSAPIPGTLEDWPAWIAEPILEKIEQQCKARVGWEARIVSSGCYHDAMTGHYLRVLVGEFPTEQTMQNWKNGRLN